MEERIRRKGNLITVRMPKELDHHFAQPFIQELDKELMKGDIKVLAFDFSDTAFMDSAGIGMLMGRYRLMNYAGGRVAAIHVGERVHRIMQISGIEKYIEVSQDAVWSQKR